MRDPLRDPRPGDVIRCWTDDCWAVAVVSAVSDDRVAVMTAPSGGAAHSECFELEEWPDWSMWDSTSVLHAADDGLSDAERDAAAMAESWADDKAREDYHRDYIAGWADACRDIAASIRRGEHRGAWMRGDR